MRVKRKLFLTTAFSALLGVGAFAGVASQKESNPVEVKAIDYSSTIRVYFQIDTSKWGTINYVRLGTDQATGKASLTSSNAKYNLDLGNYVRDISSSSNYDRMGCFFSENNTWFQYNEYSGYKPIEGGYKPGYEYQIKNIYWTADKSGYKEFGCDVYEIGEIRDNAQNSTFYFVDGYSWHSSRSVTAYFWGGTASSGAFPGATMTDSGLRIKAVVDETEFSGLYIMKYTLSGSAAYVKFSNNNGGQATGDLALTDGGIYFYHVDGKYQPVVELLISLNSQVGSYTYNGRSFASSICHLNQSQASTFVSTYNTLESSVVEGIASSVAGSGLVTYDTPETSNVHTGEISLQEIKAQLIKKYPALSSLGRIALINSITGTTGGMIAIIAVSGAVIAAVGGYFLFRKKKEN